MQAGETAWLAEQEATRAQAAGEAGRAELERLRADAEKMLAGFRAEAAAELAQVRAACGHAPSVPGARPAPSARGLARLRASTGHDSGNAKAAGRTPRPREGTQP